MVDQATLSNGRSRTRWNGRSERPRRLGDLGRDAAALAELQWKLLEEDLRAVKRRALLPAVLLIAALVLALGSAPVLLLAMAAAMEAAGLPAWAAQFLAAIVGLGGAVACGVSAWRKAKTCLASLERSYQELQENLRWMKNTFVSNEAREQAPPDRR